MSREDAPRGSDAAGISLIGLLVVVLVMGVLAAIAVTSIDSGGSGSGSGSVAVGHHRGSTAGGPEVSAAARAACEVSAQAIETAAQAYYAGHAGTWPPDLAALTAGPAPLLRTTPDPKWGLVYDPATGTVDAAGCARL